VHSFALMSGFGCFLVCQHTILAYTGLQCSITAYLHIQDYNLTVLLWRKYAKLSMGLEVCNHKNL